MQANRIRTARVAPRQSRLVLRPSAEGVLLDDGRLLLVPVRGEPIQVDAPWGSAVHAHVIDGEPIPATLSADQREVLDETLRALAVQGMLVPAARLAMADAPRYEEQVRWFEASELDGDQAQRRLAASTVLVLGLDCFGGGIASLLTRSGVGTLVLADDDRVDEPRLANDLLFDREDIGVRRSVAAARRLELINEHTQLAGVNAAIDTAADLASVIRRHRPDLVVVAHRYADDRALEWLDEVVFGAGIPVLQGGTHSLGVSVGPLLVPDATPCLACYRDAAGEGTGWGPDVAADHGPVVAWSDAAAASLACAQVISQLVGGSSPAVLGRELHFDAADLTPTWHEPTRVHAACGRAGCTA